MGRPLNKKYFGNPALPGSQIVLTSAWIAGAGSAAAGFYIVKQVGTGKYLVSNGTDSGVVKLVDLIADAEGEATLAVQPFGSAQLEYVKNIYSRTVKTFDDNTYKWSTEAATEEGAVDLPFDLTPPANNDVILTAEASGGGIVGYQLEGFGSLEGSLDDVIVALYDDNTLDESKLILEGDTTAFTSVTVVFTEFANVTLTSAAYSAGPNTTTYTGTTFEFTDGVDYVLESLTKNA